MRGTVFIRHGLRAGEYFERPCYLEPFDALKLADSIGAPKRAIYLISCKRTVEILKTHLSWYCAFQASSR